MKRPALMTAKTPITAQTNGHADVESDEYQVTNNGP